MHLYRDLERFKSSWLAISPEDRDAVEDFYGNIKKLHSFEVPTQKPMDMMNVFEKIRMMLAMKEAGSVIQKFSRISFQEYAYSFKHPAFRETLANFLPEKYSAFPLFFALAAFTRGNASVPRGGSRALALRMADRYREIGGAIEAPLEAVELDISDNRVTRLACAATTQGCNVHRVYPRQ